MQSPPLADGRVLVLYEQPVTGASTPAQFVSFLGAMGNPQAEFEGRSHPGLVGVFDPHEAFTRTYTHDAHFTSYALFEADGSYCRQGWTRINKELAPVLAQAGAHVRTVFVGVDLDTVGHGTWTTDGITEPTPNTHVPDLVGRLTAAGLSDWWAFYLTKRGARLVYRLLTPVSFVDVEGHIRGLLTRLVDAGLGRSKVGPFHVGRFVVDFEGSSDWTRLLRLPRVIRDGVSFHDTEVAFQLDQRLDLLAVPPIGKAAPTISTKYQGVMPDEDDVEINFGDGGKWVDWKRAAIRYLGNTEAGMVAAGKKQLVEGDGQQASGRNDAIVRVAGSAVSRLYQWTLDPNDALKSTTAPEAIYGLLLPAVQQFAPDETSRLSWPQVLWSAVTRMWDKEAAKFAQFARQKEEQAAQTTSSIVEGFGRWCDDPEFVGAPSESEKLEYVKRQLVVTAGGGAYFVLCSDGYYRADSVGKDVLIATMRASGLDKIVDFEREFEDVKGQKKKWELTEQYVLRRYTLPVTGIEGQPASKELPGGAIYTFGKERILRVPIFGIRDDIEPEYNAAVDGWLQSFGHDEVFEVIQKTLDLKTPMPLTAIIGPPSIGKQLYVRGLQECVTTQALATDKDFGTFGPNLMRSPLLLINEDVEERIGGKETSALIRQYTSGDGVEVNRKFKNQVTVSNAMRVIVTANNEDVLLRLLGQNKDLSPDDRDALTLRVVHLPISDAPAKYLEALGGFAYTSKEGQRWVRGVDGAKSDYIVAKHFLWIHRQQKYGAHVNGRFAMKGKMPHEMLFALSTGGASSALVVKTLLGMVEASTLVQRQQYGFVIGSGGQKDRIHVTAAEVLSFYESVYQDKSKKNLNEKSVGKALIGLRAPGSSNNARFIPERKDKKNRWNEILLTTLLTAGTEHGSKTDVLLKLAKDAGIPLESAT